MGIVQLNQLATNIESSLGALIDVSDVKAGNVADVKLSRGLAAWSLVQRCQISPELAAKSITDGFDDMGIDAVWVDSESNTIFLVQSKWSKSGTGSISSGDMLKFLQGVRKFVNAEFTGFNAKFQNRKLQFESALGELDVQIALIVVHSGSDKMSDSADDSVKALLAEMNDPIETVTFEYFPQKELHALLRSAARGKKPDVDATLYDWGAIEEPYQAFYGQVAAHEVAGWYEQNGTRLLADNIRQFLGDSEVNQSITATLLDSPEKFWYLNNGITALCDGFTKAAAGGTSKKAGKFRFNGVSIVNGAQTVGCLATVNAEHPDQVADARVTVRFISLESCPPEFSQEVTRGTNTQNRVERRDFVSLDPVQDRLVADLNLSGIRYAIKSGSETPRADQGFSVMDATIALACAHSDTDFSTQAKREVGRLWAGAESPSPDSQYRQLFSTDLTAHVLWQTVRVLRKIDETIADLRKSREGRESLVGIHGNRLIAHIVFSGLPAAWRAEPQDVFDEMMATLPGRTKETYELVIDLVDEKFEGNYLASLFKNGSKCRELAAGVVAASASGSSD